MRNEKLGSLEAICLMLIIIVNAIVLNIPNLIILSVGTSAIINVIYIGLIAIIITLLLSKLFSNFPGKDILDVSQFLGGKFLKNIIAIPFILLFLLLSIIAVYYLSRSIKIIYFNNSPFSYIVLFFIVPAVFINKIGFKAISGINIIIIPIVFVSLFFLFITSYENFSFDKIFPILGNGFKETFLIGSSNIFSFTNIIFLLFLPSLLKNFRSFKNVSIISIIISAFILVFTITTLILTLPIVTESDEMLSIYLLTRMVSFGNFLERLDAFFIFSWILTLLSSLSITIFYIIQILKKILNLQDEKILAGPGFIILGGTLLIRNYAQIKFLGNYIYRYGFIILVFGIAIPVLILANIKFRKFK